MVGEAMTEEDEAFNEIERRSKAKKDAVESSVNAKEALTKLLIDSYDQGVKDALESATQAIKELRTWVGLTRDEQSFVYQTLHNATSRIDSFWVDFANAIEAKLKEKNT
jgi:hypothetical protein